MTQAERPPCKDSSPEALAESAGSVVTFRPCAMVMLRNKSIVRALLCVRLLVGCLETAAQVPASPASTAQKKGKVTRIDNSRERGVSLLEQAIARSDGYDPASRATVYYLAGHALGSTGSQFAKDSLEMAYRTLDQLKSDKSPGLFMLEGNIVRETALVMPKQVEEGLPQDETMRAPHCRLLLKRTLNRRKSIMQLNWLR